jgi:hypothetical protein
LTTGQTLGADRAAETDHDIQDAGRVHVLGRVLRHVLKALRKEGVPSQNGHVFAVDNLWLIIIIIENKQYERTCKYIHRACERLPVKVVIVFLLTTVV